MSKLWETHAEADTLPELHKLIKGALAELEAKMGGPVTAGGKAGGGGGPTVAPKGDAPKHTLDEVKKALTGLKDAHDAKEAKSGIKVIKALLKEFGVTESPKLKEEQYPAVMAAIAKAMPGEEEGGEDY